MGLYTDCGVRPNFPMSQAGKIETIFQWAEPRNKTNGPGWGIKEKKKIKWAGPKK